MGFLNSLSKIVNAAVQVADAVQELSSSQQTTQSSDTVVDKEALREKLKPILNPVKSMDDFIGMLKLLNELSVDECILACYGKEWLAEDRDEIYEEWEKELDFPKSYFLCTMLNCDDALDDIDHGGFLSITEPVCIIGLPRFRFDDSSELKEYEGTHTLFILANYAISENDLLSANNDKVIYEDGKLRGFAVTITDDNITYKPAATIMEVQRSVYEGEEHIYCSVELEYFSYVYLSDFLREVAFYHYVGNMSTPPLSDNMANCNRGTYVID